MQCKGYGRELFIKFTCSRCGATIEETLESASARSHEHYDQIDHMTLPKGWSDWCMGSRVLCDQCTLKLKKFFEGEG